MILIKNIKESGWNMNVESQKGQVKKKVKETDMLMKITKY